jgi:hypothetical protein
MPRQPVKPQERQRVVRACEGCKASKKRCDGNQPCKSCQKKGYNGSCHYTAGRRHHPLPQPPSALPQLAAAQSVPLVVEGSGTDGVMMPQSSWDFQGPTTVSAGNPGPGSVTDTQEHVSNGSSRSSCSNDTRGSPIEPMAQPSVMLSSVSGEKGKHQYEYSIDQTHTCDRSLTVVPNSIYWQHSRNIVSAISPKDTETLCWPFWFH